MGGGGWVQQELQELAGQIMGMVETLVLKTQVRTACGAWGMMVRVLGIGYWVKMAESEESLALCRAIGGARGFQER